MQICSWHKSNNIKKHFSYLNRLKFKPLLMENEKKADNEVNTYNKTTEVQEMEI